MIILIFMLYKMKYILPCQAWIHPECNTSNKLQNDVSKYDFIVKSNAVSFICRKPTKQALLHCCEWNKFSFSFHLQLPETEHAAICITIISHTKKSIKTDCLRIKHLKIVLIVIKLPSSNYEVFLIFRVSFENIQMQVLINGNVSSVSVLYRCFQCENACSCRFSSSLSQ